jgi:transposase
MLNWPVDAIVEHTKASKTMVYDIKSNLARYGSTVRPQMAKFGWPSKLTKADEKAVFEWLLTEG